MKNKIIILSLVFVVLVIMLIPAKFVQNLIPTNVPIQLENMTGTAWSGQVGNARIQGLIAEDINYDISFFALLMASLSGNAEIENGDLTGSFEFFVSDQKNLSVDNASVKMTADTLEKFIPFPGILLQGALSTDKLSVQLAKAKVVLLSGVTSWNNATVTINNQRQVLGNFVIDWSTNEANSLITGRLRKTKNEIGLEGSITLDKTGVAEFKGSISSSADRNLYTALSLFADGKVELGRLPIKFKKKIQ